MSDKPKSNVDIWLQQETEHKRKALEKASKHFDENDSLTVNLLEAIYGQESSFGINRGTRGSENAAGDFRLIKKTAKRMGLTVSKNNDQRFDIDEASWAAAKYLKMLDVYFSRETVLIDDLKTVAIQDCVKRKNFSVAAYNAGEGSIARAQQEAQKAEKNPQVWSEVKDFLEAAGVTPDKVKEILHYVDNVINYEIEFSKKSLADKNIKHKEPALLKQQEEKGHRVTIDDKHVLIHD